MDAGLYLPFQPLPPGFPIPISSCLHDALHLNVFWISHVQKQPLGFSFINWHLLKTTLILSIPLAKNLSYSFFLPLPCSSFKKSFWVLHLEFIVSDICMIAPLILLGISSNVMSLKGLSFMLLHKWQVLSLLCILHPTFSFYGNYHFMTYYLFIVCPHEKKLEKMGFVFVSCYKVQDRSWNSKLKEKLFARMNKLCLCFIILYNSVILSLQLFP